MSTEVMNWIASVLAGLSAMALFLFHVITSPQRKHWISLPEYIRRGIFVAGAVLMWRSVNFTVIADSPSAIGQINAEGLLALATTAYLFMAGAFFAMTKTFPPRVWERLNYIAQLASRKGVRRQDD